MITPARINDISNEIATIYAHISDELLVNIGKHITSPNWTHTASWEIQKLAELGQLTAENAAIINKWIKAIPPELRNAMEETRKAALDEIEKQMDAAAKRGYVTPPVTDSSVAVFQDMQNQAADRLNLVNTTMLQSSVDQYQRAITITQQEYDRLMAQQEATQRALNEGAGSVASGVETRRVAVRRAIGRISAEGLTGFIDRAGRHWTPEAYVNMDVRTTVHNTAIQATRARMNDFGTQVFQVSSHAGARPLCYPYQGKFYSWDNTSGTIELGDGSVVSYEPINSTSYGQPAGVFGINCGHYPIPIIAGVTIPHGADNIQPEEENDKAYALSQEQRALERKIREAKRLVEMAGDSATPEDKQKVKDAQAQMREFIAKTGRTRRYDREQIGGTPQTKATGDVGNVNAPLTPVEPTAVKYGTAVESIRAKYRDSVMETLDNAPEDIKKAWNLTSDDLKRPNYDAGSGAYYQPSTKDVHFKNQAKAYEQSDYQEQNACYFHEYGHNIDNLLSGSRFGYMSSKYDNGAFGKSLYSECEARLREFMYKYRGYGDEFDVIAERQNGPNGMGMGSYMRQALRGVLAGEEYRANRSYFLDAGNDPSLLRPIFNQYLKGTQAVADEIQYVVRHDKETAREFCKYVKNNYTMYERTDVSDMFNQYMLNQFGIGYPFGIGHENSYWGSEGNYSALAEEAFAEMFSATTTQNKSLGTIKEFFPESYSMFEEMLNGAVNK